MIDSATKVLVTGGTGYIGSHICIALIKAGITPVVIDNLSNIHPAVLDRIAVISKHRPVFYAADVRNNSALRQIFSQHKIRAVMHLAGLKAISESVEQPGLYYRNNVEGALELFKAMGEAGVKHLIFSSSAAVYGPPDIVPVPESAPIRPASPYGQTKSVVEQVLRDLHSADDSWGIGILRYFNAVGAHESGLIGEDPRVAPQNLMPFIARVATGRQARLLVFGDDYSTPDGTGIRDYLHVMDLAEGHVLALVHLFRDRGLFTLNLGTGSGYSVLNAIEAFEKASSRRVPYEIVARRKGDVGTCYADASKARAFLGWHAKRDLHRICSDIWKWYSMNPTGYSASLAEPLPTYVRS